MRNSLIAMLVVLALALPQALFPQAAMPRMTSVEPANAKAGDTLSVAGENLEKANVAELYLTDGKNDLKVAVEEQTATGLKFKIPGSCKSGRFALMVLTGGKEPKLIEQPVKVTVE
ncbi:MAG: hypothetical protein LC130_02620 [Bryobacterales bacterium]|nr:hypothetical protein [Bryobacterales bacterium]MEB2362069.1 hypothetical protein [Bryobacterales bacterium]